MASAKDIQITYDVLHPVWMKLIPPPADLTCGRYETGAETLQEAQIKKLDWILNQLNIKKGQSFLDIGCGYGNLMSHAKSKNIKSQGITLSDKQVRFCKNNGLNVASLDWNDITPNTFKNKSFDALTCVEAVEHFCTPELSMEGKQDELYHKFFSLCRRLIKDSGIFYYQGMVWGPNVPWNPENRFNRRYYNKVKLSAPRYSRERLLYSVMNFFPGSFLPYGGHYLPEIAKKNGFKLTHEEDGTDEYVRTAGEWYLIHLKSRWWLDPKLWPHYLKEGIKRPRQMQGWMEYCFTGAQMWVFIMRYFGLKRFTFKAI